MRQILHDHARAKQAAKRDGGGARQPVTSIEATGADPIDLLALDDALQRLAEVDPSGARLVDLRFFGGLTVQEVAEVTGTPVRSVERSWRRCRAWVKARLAVEDPDPA